MVDRFIVGPRHEKAIKAGIAATLLVGDGLLQVHVARGANKAEAERFYKALASPTHHFVYGDIGPEYFVFNNPESACRTCGGLGVDKLTHPELLIPDPKRSILGGCFVREAFKYNPDTWDGRVMFSLSTALGFALDSPWHMLPEICPQRHPLRHRAAAHPDRLSTGCEGQAAGAGGTGSRVCAASRGASNATTGATASAEKRTRRWKRGSTR